MQRVPLLVLAFACIVLMPAQAQDSSRSLERSQARPPEQLPTSSFSSSVIYLNGNTLGAPSDTLSEADILRRIARIYQYQAELLAAQSMEDADQTERLLDLAMTELATLARQPEITERPRYRELYRTVVTEYERYYGVSDVDLGMPFGDIFQARADMFAVLEGIDQPLLEDVMLPPLEPMETVVPMTTNRVVEQTITYFLTKKRDVLERWMTRADTYFPMIEQIFREEGVPDELKYLALVESGLNPRARSWAQAVGMWQFIAATGRYYGLEVNAWVDERMDPEKATRAAARHLKDLYAQYGNNWHVALAGYNCSPRCIKRAISRAGGTLQNPPSYWDMYEYLPRETRGYVPQFIAFSLIMSNPEAFDLRSVQPGPRYAYEHVPVRGMISLDLIAEMAGTDEATIKALNPELQRSTLPPNQGMYMLRIPVGTYGRFAAAVAELPEEAVKPVTEYIVRRGDSLGKIANQGGVSVTALKQANGLRSNTIHPGQRLIVPVPTSGGTIKLADARPVKVEYGVRTIRPIQPAEPMALASATRGPSAQDLPVRNASTTAMPRTTASSASTPSTSPATPKTAEAGTKADTRVVYRVRRGDTLGKIAAKYGVSVRDIQGWNSLRGTTIRSGQRLTLYAGSGTPSQPESVVYRVQRGDNLTTLANKYGVTVNSIKSWNNLRSSTIKVGQRLTIHPGQSAPNYTVYKVRRGDSLGKIAKQYGTTVSKIKSWNGLRRNTIHPVQRLKIYS